MSRYFNNVFSGQINSLICEEECKAHIELDIKDKVIKLIFEKNKCKNYYDEVGIAHKAVYIDSPYVIDQMNTLDYLNPTGQLLESLLRKENTDVMEGVIGSVLAKEKLNDILAMLEDVVQGEIVCEHDDEFYLKSTQFSKPVMLCNLSNGLKSFVIIKMLLEKGALKNKDVLILDEPEIHLHPQWQVLYAELIVLLNLRMVMLRRTIFIEKHMTVLLCLWS